MMFEASSSLFELINQLLGFWTSVAALVILLNFFMVKRENSKNIKVYRLFLYFAGLSFIYSMMLTAVHQTVRYYHRVSDYNDYISTNQEVVITAALTLVLYFWYWKWAKEEITINRITIVLLGVFSAIAAYTTFLNYLS